MRKNRKANIPIVFLVIGIVAICGFAILSFVISDGKFSKGFSDISVIEKIRVDKERMEFYGPKGINILESESGNEFDIRPPSTLINREHLYVEQGKIVVGFALG